MAVRVLGLFLTRAVFGLWSVIVAFPGHTHLLNDQTNMKDVARNCVGSFGVSFIYQYTQSM